MFSELQVYLLAPLKANAIQFISGALAECIPTAPEMASPSSPRAPSSGQLIIAVSPLLKYHQATGCLAPLLQVLQVHICVVSGLDDCFLPLPLEGNYSTFTSLQRLLLCLRRPRDGYIVWEKGPVTIKNQSAFSLASEYGHWIPQPWLSDSSF